ncbi:alpha/beta fold hydrolase [Paracoccus aminophilus]|uniref:Alpha/beta hydrolase fold protein n=1 Tax=Paracoccus aminophilus JCM 7686 TaxID=1367847 RepID=S5YEA8_PARAH|nr:alpha/beta fold hydrolase [Paracoccus aminophilus]AGT09828.1 alpha/beta hydrolase fold protein [Paracoccus aminophilus JCM 7686]
MLNFTTMGEANGLPPVVLAHGLFGSSKNLGGVARRLAQERRVLSVDMRNHGDSFHSPDHSYAALAADLAEVIAAEGSRADLIGHSMGGKAAMTLALSRPELLRRLAVLDIAPLAYQHSQSGLIDAMEGLDLAGVTLRSEADRRLSARIETPGVRAFLLQSLDLKSDPPQWKMNLPALRAEMDKITGWPDDLAPAAFGGPVLVLAGAESDYCAGPAVAAITQYFPQAEIEFIPGAGHWLHAEAPAIVSERLAAFLA